MGEKRVFPKAWQTMLDYNTGLLCLGAGGFIDIAGGLAE